ncbi:MAG: sulfatase-like hydrolase/transferase [Labilithrix sp.]|nr:sulfatase-like hydrolase/transferase [Labilithrix sp.]
MFRALLRLVLAVTGASAAAILVALLEARAAAAAIVESGSPEAPSLGSLVLADLGVLFPIVLAVAAAVATADLVLEPGDPKSPAAHLAELRAGPVVTRLRTASIAPLAVFAVSGWSLGSAHLARSALAAGKPPEAGLSVGIGSVALLLAVVSVAISLVPVTRRVLAASSETVPRLLDPILTGGVAAGIVFLLFCIGIATGDTAGEGGVLGIFGVLKREELDLRPVANAALLAAGAYVVPIAFGRGKVGEAERLPLGAAGVGILLTSILAILCVRDASALGDDPLVARGLERHAPLGKISLAVLRKATDGDKDGYSARFGGGDCNDADPTVNPGALDVPGNGVDEDCSGADTPAPAAPVHVAAPTPVKKTRRTYNVILFTVDTLRIDLGFLGYPKPVSPNLDKLAERSTVFERAYSMASYTGKSVGPMMIGKYPSETLRDFSHFNTYAPRNEFVAERVRDTVHARTFAAHCHWYFRLPTGLNQGFDVWDTSAIPPGMGDNDNSITSDRMSNIALKLLGNPENVTPGVPGAIAADADGGAPDAEADGAAPEPPKETPAEPGKARRFFGWFHFFDPHAQYVPHAGAPDFSGGPLPAKALYDQEVWFTDLHIGRVLDYIASQPWAEDTAIIITADHGEAFADHGMSWHGSEIWESLVRVPLVVYVPGEKPRRVSAKRSHIDVAPTIVDLMGATAEEGELRGESLLDDVMLAPGKEHEERDVLVDMPAGPYNGIRRALITGPSPGMKLIHSGGSSYALFDLAADPAEKRDLSSDKEKLAPIMQQLQTIRAGLKEIEVRPQ